MHLSLALSTLAYEWRRYLAAVVAIAFCGSLILAFTGLFSGVALSYSGITNSTPADLIAFNAQAKSWFDRSDTPRRVIPELYAIPGVQEVAQLSAGSATWEDVPVTSGGSGGGSRVGVMVVAAEIARGSLTMPEQMSDVTIAALQVPMTVAIDRTSLRKLGVEVGDRVALNDKVVTVGAIVDGFPNAGGRPVVFASRQTAAMTGVVRENAPQVDTLLIRLDDPARADEVRGRVEEATDGALRAWTKQGLEAANQKDLIADGGLLGTVLIFLVVFGALIGSVIAWQTIKGAVFASIREFGALSALGVSMNSLRAIVIELSLWMAAFAYLMASLLFVAVSLVARNIGLPMAYPIWAFAGVAAVFAFIAAVAGALSLQILNKTDPADLLR